MLKFIAGDAFGVGKAPSQIRRISSINVGGLSDNLMRTVTEGIERHGKEYLDSDDAKRMFRASTGFNTEVQRPEIVLGSSRVGQQNYLRDYLDIYRVTMLLEKETPGTRTSSYLQYVVSGYTDRVSHRGRDNRDVSLDPDTILHITNVVALRVTPRRGLGGATENDYAVISSNSYLVGDTIDARKEWTLSPSDITLYTEEVDNDDVSPFSVQSYGDNGIGGVSISQSVTSPDNHIRSAAIGESDAIHNRSYTLGCEEESALASTTAASRYTDVDGGALYSYTGNSLARRNLERSINNDDFYMTLRNSIDPRDVDDISMVRGECCIRIGSLMRACGIREGDIDRYIGIEIPRSDDYDSASWGGATYDENVAYDVCHRIPDLMSNNLMKGVSFIVSNMGRRTYGRNEVEFRYADDYDASNRRTYAIKPMSGIGHLDKFFLDQFEEKVIDEVFNHLSENGAILLEMVVHSTLSAITRVEVRYEDNRMEPYNFTSFIENRLSSNLSDAASRGGANLISQNSKLRSRLKMGMTLHNKGQWDTDLDPIRPSDTSRGQSGSSLSDLLSRSRR